MTLIMLMAGCYGLGLVGTLLRSVLPQRSGLPLVAAALLLIGTCSTQAEIHDAVVMIDGCSGVCVDPGGIVLSARHCDHPEQVQIRFTDRVVPAQRVYLCPESEGAVAYDCEGDGYPCIPIAPVKPQRGDVVTAYGYAGMPRRLVTRTGPVLGGAPLEFRSSPFDGNIVDLVAMPGMSGGPVVNSQGEVVGLVSASGGCDTACISWTSCRAALRGATLSSESVNADERPTLLVFTTATCTACQQFKHDYENDQEFAAALNAAFDIELVDADERPDLAEHYGITNVPAFITPDGQRIVGYEGSDDLLIALGLAEQPAAVDPVTAEEAAAEESDAVAAPQPAGASTNPLDRVVGITQRAVTIATWLGVIGSTGGIGGAILGGLALWRTFRRPRQSRDPPVPIPIPIPKPPVIAVDTAPPPQAIVPETKFAAYERDTFAEAFAWAQAEMARKYPGVIGTLDSIQGLIDQYLAGKGYRPAKGDRP